MTRVGTALAAAVALLSVSACTGEEPAGGDPTTSAPSPRATPSPTPTPAAPTIPPEATEHSADGAAAFVKYYIAVFNHAEPNLEVSDIESLTSSGVHILPTNDSAPPCNQKERRLFRRPELEPDDHE